MVSDTLTSKLEIEPLTRVVDDNRIVVLASIHVREPEVPAVTVDLSRPPRMDLYVSSPSVSTMPEIDLEQKTVDRLDALREDDESREEVLNELISILETEERLLARYGDET